MKSNLSNFTFLLIILCLSFYRCNESPLEQELTFLGEAKAVEQAEEMFSAIGGKDAWCALRSLYIKAEHTEPQMAIPYTSQIWRAIDTFELVIEQQNDSFHVKAIFREDGGTIRYYDKRDTTRTLSGEQLKGWAFSNKHNVYVLLHDLACNPSNYKVEIDDEELLTFYQDTVFVTSFGLDEQMRPHLFYSPNPDGKISGSKFTHWGTDGGLIHSAGGHPLDSNFIYKTEIWQPSKQSMEESFGKSIFEL